MYKIISPLLFIILISCDAIKESCPDFLCASDKASQSNSTGSEIENQCFSNYRNEWAKSHEIFKNLDKECFDDQRKDDIETLIDDINKLTNTESLTNSRHLYELAEKYASAQNNLAYCRLATFHNKIENLTESKDMDETEIKFDDNYFLHMLGDDFGSSSGLEGIHPADGVKVLRERLRFFDILLEDKQKYILSEKQTKPCSDIASVPHQSDYTMPAATDFDIKEVENLRNLTNIAYKIKEAQNNSFESFHKSVKKQIDSLSKESNFFYFKGGWYGHAFILYIAKNTVDNSYSFRIYNSGGGLEFHSSISYEGKNKYLPYFEIIDVTYENISSVAFIKMIYDIADFKAEREAGGSELFYKAVTTVLEGNYSTKKPEFDDFFDVQLAGTCSYYSVPYSQKDFTKNSNLSTHIEYYFKTRLLGEYFYKHKDRILKQHVPHQLFRKSAEILNIEAANVSKEKSKSYLSSGEADYVSEKTKKYLDILNQFLEDFEENLKKEIIGGRDGKETSGSHDMGKAITHAPTHSYGTIYLDIMSYDISDASGINDQITALNTNLEQILDYSSAEIKASTFSELKNLIAMLSLDEDTSVWKNIPDDDRFKVLEKIYILSKSYLYFAKKAVLNHPSLERGLSSSEIFAQIKLLTIADILRKELQLNGFHHNYANKNFNLEDQIPSMYQSSFKDLINNFLIDTSISNVKWKNQVKELKKYWEDNYNDQPFFAWEKRPVHGDTKRQLFSTQLNMQKGDDGLSRNWSKQMGVPPFNQWPDLHWQYRNMNNLKADRSLNDFEGFTKLENYVGFSHENALFNVLRDISYITNYFINGSFARNNIESSSELYDENCSFKTRSKFKIVDGTLEYDGFETIKYFISCERYTPYLSHDEEEKLTQIYQGAYIEKPDIKIGFADGSINSTKLKKAMVSNSEYMTTSLKSRRREESNNYVTILTGKDDEISLDRFRQIIHLSGDRNLQINETLSYFKQNKGLFADSEYRILFNKLIFEPELLEQEFRDNPNLANDLAKLCLNQKEKAIKRNDIATALYFVNLNQLFNESFDYAKRLGFVSTTLVSPFMNSFQTYLGILNTVTNPLVKGNILRYLLRTFLNKINFNNDEELRYFLIANIYLRVFPVEILEDQKEFYELEGQHYKWIKRIDDSLSNGTQDRKNDILNDVAAFFDSSKTFPGVDWSNLNTNKSYSIQDVDATSSIDINLAYMKIKFNGEDLVVLPNNIKNHTDFIKTVGKYDHTSVTKFANIYTLNSLDGFPYRIAFKDNTDGKKVLIIQRQWENRIFEKLSAEHILASVSKNEWGLFTGYDNWIEVDGRLLSDPSRVPKIPVSKSFSSDDFLVLLCPPGENNVVMVSLYDKASKKLNKIHKVDAGVFSKETLEAVTKNDKSYSFLLDIENPMYIWPWKNRTTKKTSHIQLPRLGLTIVKDNEGELKIVQFPNHRIGEKKIEDLGTFKGYIYLHKNGDERVLIPLSTITKANDSGLNFAFQDIPKSNIFEPYGSKKTAIKLFEYPLSHSDNKLLYNKISQKAYLAYIQFNLFRYNEARKLLRGSDSYLGAYDKTSMQVFENIFSTIDGDPKAVAVKANLVYLLIYNYIQNFLEPDKNIFKQMLSEYSEYIDKNKNISEKWLSFEEEKLIAQSLLSWLETVSAGLKDEIKIKIRTSFSQRLAFIMKERPSLARNSPVEINFNSYVYLSSSIVENAKKVDECKAGKITIWNGGGLGLYFFDFYEVIFAHLSNDSNMANLAQVLFQKLKYPIQKGREIDEIKSYLKVVAVNSDFSDQSSLAKFLLNILVTNSLRLIPNKEDLEINIKDNKFINEHFDHLDKIYEYSASPDLSQINIPKKKDSSYDNKKGKYAKYDEFKMEITDDLKDYALSEAVLSEERLEEIITIKKSQRSNDFYIDAVHLKKTLESSTGDKYIDSHLKIVSDKLDSFIEEKTSEPLYLLEKVLQLEKQSESWNTQAKDLLPKIKVIRDELIVLADKMALSERDIYDWNTKIYADYTDNPNFNLMLNLYGNEDLKEVVNKNPNIHPKDLSKITKLMTQYLILSTYRNKIKSLSSLAKNIAETDSSDISSDFGIQEKLKDFVVQVRQKRNYEIELHPDYLVFEYIMGFLLRGQQTDTLNKLRVYERKRG